MKPETFIDTAILRNELEGIAALNLPDLTREMRAALQELPALKHHTKGFRYPLNGTAQLMAWVWEAGRRYGLLEALAALDGSTKAFTDFITEEVERARDRMLTLELPQQPAPAPVAVPADPATDAALEIVRAANNKNLHEAADEAIERLRDMQEKQSKLDIVR